MNDAPQVTTESRKPLWKLVVTLLLIGGLVWGLYYVLVLSKKGSVIMTLTSPDFTDLKDFEVDEKNKTIFILNGSSLLKVTMP